MENAEVINPFHYGIDSIVLENGDKGIHWSTLDAPMLRIQVSVQILIPLIFYSAQLFFLSFIHACICSLPVFVVFVVTIVTV